MAFTPKTWVNRSVQYAGRYLSTPVVGETGKIDLSRAEGTIFAEGDKPDATALNDLEARIDSAFANIQDELGWTDITSQCTWNANLNTTALGGVNHYVKVNTKLRIVDMCGLFNAGRTNSSPLVTIPTTYVPSSPTNTPLGVSRYDTVKAMSVNYFVNTIGQIFGSHSVATSTGMEENIHFTFTY